MPRPAKNVPWLDQVGSRWYAFWYDTKARRSKRLSLGTTDPGEAQNRFAAFLTNRDAFTKPAAGLTVEQALDDYWREHANTNIVARDRAEGIIRLLNEWFEGTPLSDIDIPACRAYAAARRAGQVGGRIGVDATIRRELGLLKAAAAHEMRWRRIGPTASPPTPMPSIELPKAAPVEAQWLTREELKLVLTLADGPLHDFIMLAYYTAGRRASVELLTPFQVDLERNRINLRRPDETDAQKRSKKRRPVVPIDPAIRTLVEELMAKNAHTGLLLGTDYKHFYVPFRGLLTKLGLADKAHPHVLRHSRASHLLQDGVPLFDVARLLGDNVTTVERVYGHHCPDYLGATIGAKTGA